MNADLIRIVDGIARDKNIDRESIFGDLEDAMASAARKQFGATEEVEVRIDRETGAINAYLNEEEIDIRKLGRIPAQTAKQVMIQKLREDERGSIYTEYQDRVGEMVSGTVARFEGGTIIVNLGRTEALLPRSEQIPGETHHASERIRGLIYEVKEATNQVKIILTRTHPDFIRRLFEQEVPEVSEKIIDIKGLSREAGYRSKVAVTSIDSKVDAVGACVGVRGSRIKNIVDELGGEKIDIVRWNESSQVLIGNALRPAEIREIALCFELNRATVVVGEDQLSLAIGKRGQNVRLAARLTNWDIDVLTPKEYTEGLETMIQALRAVEVIDDTVIDKVVALGIVSVLDLEEVGPEPLMESLGLDEVVAKSITEQASKIASEVATKQEQSKATQTVLGSKESGGEGEAAETNDVAETEQVIEGVDDATAIEAADETDEAEETEAESLEVEALEVEGGEESAGDVEEEKASS